MLSPLDIARNRSPFSFFLKYNLSYLPCYLASVCTKAPLIRRSFRDMALCILQSSMFLIRDNPLRIAREDVSSNKQVAHLSYVINSSRNQNLSNLPLSSNYPHPPARRTAASPPTTHHPPPITSPHLISSRQPTPRIMDWFIRAFSFLFGPAAMVLAPAVNVAIGVTLTVLSPVISIALPVLGPVVGPVISLALNAIGFTAAGVRLGSVAAVVHGALGNVVAGSAFAGMQHLGAVLGA